MRTLLQLSLEMKTLSNKTKITGGNWKGRSIDIIDKSNVKPTKSYIRENLFNWIGHNLSNKWIVDAFAGSGSLGFEAASRKAGLFFVCSCSSSIDLINLNVTSL